MSPDTVNLPDDNVIKSSSRLWPIIDPDIRIFPASSVPEVIFEVVVIVFSVFIVPKPVSILPEVNVPTVAILKCPVVEAYLESASFISNFVPNLLLIL